MAKPTFPAIPLTVGKKIKASEDYLKAQHNKLAGFESVDDLVTDDSVLTKRELRAIEHHMVAIRSTVARALWSREYLWVARC